jgi:hypothetical protein
VSTNDPAPNVGAETGISPGQAWGVPEQAEPELVVRGDDADLARALAGSQPGVLVSFSPSPESDLARAVGLQAGAPRQGLALPMDVLELEDGTLCVNALVLGKAPDRVRWRDRSFGVKLRLEGRVSGLDIPDATGVVVATGQWIRGLDVVPRGHPGDGKVEIHIYRIRRADRKAMRLRLPAGTHLPHPGIVCRTAVQLDLTFARSVHAEIDGRPTASLTTLRAVLLPARYRLLI